VCCDGRLGRENWVLGAGVGEKELFCPLQWSPGEDGGQRSIGDASSQDYSKLRHHDFMGRLSGPLLSRSRCQVYSSSGMVSVSFSIPSMNFNIARRIVSNGSHKLADACCDYEDTVLAWPNTYVSKQHRGTQHLSPVHPPI
jgi:hypothetical protein